ncbi:MAG: hypothetical protein FD146_1179 [Anaerolineaceae bacterium]|nr:MAG: hypothetical protein FD146_1179 [Anaerolineaceae bacterium]
MSRFKSPFLWFILLLLGLAVLTVLGPEEASLGQNVRIVYLHGAWALTALVAFVAAGFLGLAALLTRHPGAHVWSRALGRAAIVFWVTYLPLSLWAMQANWNGLYTSEPRFRVAVVFAGAGVLLQIGLSIIHRPFLTSLANVLFATALVWTLQNTGSILPPPPSPIFSSGIASIEIFFVVENLVALFAAFMLARWWLGK